MSSAVSETYKGTAAEKIGPSACHARKLGVRRKTVAGVFFTLSLMTFHQAGAQEDISKDQQTSQASAGGNVWGVHNGTDDWSGTHYLVVESNAGGIALYAVVDANALLSLRTGEQITLVSRSGEVFKIDGPYLGRPISLKAVGSTSSDRLNYFASAFVASTRCSGEPRKTQPKKSEPSGGPDTEETGGPELTPHSCSIDTTSAAGAQ